MRSYGFVGRWTGFVEIMVPGFSRAALDRLVPTLDLSETGWGWGLDSVWPKLLDYRNVGIVDATPVVHTRPVGQMRDPELGRRVLAESDKPTAPAKSLASASGSSVRSLASTAATTWQDESSRTCVIAPRRWQRERVDDLSDRIAWPRAGNRSSIPHGKRGESQEGDQAMR